MFQKNSISTNASPASDMKKATEEEKEPVYFNQNTGDPLPPDVVNGIKEISGDSLLETYRGRPERKLICK